MQKVSNIVYLYSEVMNYTISIMRVLVRDFGSEVDCIYWDDDRKKTPFVPKDENGITFHKRSAMTVQSIKALLDEKKPSLIYVSGRMDKGYLEVLLQVKGRIPIVSGCDNQWEGTLKNKLAVITAGNTYHKYFDYLWVPSRRSYEYARRVGYAKNKIIGHMYTGDSSVFPKVWHETKAQKQQMFPHTIAFVGRFAPEKGINLLVEAFNQAKKELSNDWRLVIVGRGDVQVQANEHIEVKDFMSAAQLGEECRNWGVFCLPSTREAWGVVVHEFAMAGLPVVCSDIVGAGDSLVINNYNGYIFESGNVADLKRVILTLMRNPEAELYRMAEASHEYSKCISPEVSAYSLLSVLK